MFKDEKQKRFFMILGTIFVVLFAILYLLIQAGVSFSNFATVITNILAVFRPILIGGIIAYLLNPILKLFERKILKKISRPMLRRALSVLLSYLLVILLIVGIFAAILPQIISTVNEFGSNIGNYISALEVSLSDGIADLNLYIEEHPTLQKILQTFNIYQWIGGVIEDESHLLPPKTEDTSMESLPESDAPTDSVTDSESLSGEESDTADGSEDATTSDSEDEITVGGEEGNETEESVGEETDTDSEASVDTNPLDPDAETTAPAPEIEAGSTNKNEKYEISYESILAFVSDKMDDLTVYLADAVSRLSEYLISVLLAFFAFLKDLVLGLFISVYILLSKERISAQTRKILYALFPAKFADEIRRISKNSDRTVGRFIVGTLIDAIIVAILTFILLSIFEIKYALLIAVIIGITNMIPFFGPFIGAIPSALLILIDDITVMVNSPDEPHFFKCITFIIIILVIQQIDGNIINPRISGNSTGLSSLGVVVAITVMSGLFGFFGMLAGVPIAAIIVSLIKELLDKLLEKKQLPVALAAYYAKNSPIPPETEEEELEHHRHTAFYRWYQRSNEKLRHLLRRVLYHGGSKPLKFWVQTRLIYRKIHHSIRHFFRHLFGKKKEINHLSTPEEQPKKPEISEISVFSDREGQPDNDTQN